MMRFFESREEMEKSVDDALNTEASLEEQAHIAAGLAGPHAALLLALKLGVHNLNELFDFDSGNEVHDMAVRAYMEEPLKRLSAALDEVVAGSKEVLWNAEICQCKKCRKQDKSRAAKFN
jgi:hypothetical protein